MGLDTYALTSVAEAKAYIGEGSQKDAFWVYYSGSASNADAQVSADTLILRHNKSQDASIDLTNSNYDTIGELVTYINGSVSNWEAGQICHSSATSANLVETGQLDALGTEEEQTLKITDDYLIERLIDRATGFIERYCDRKLKSRNFNREAYDGNGYTKLMLEQYPVTALTRVSLGRTNAFSVKNATATTHAFIEITSTAINLTVDGTVTSLTISDYSTINDVITAIEANTGWSCSLLNSDYGSYKAHYTVNSVDVSELLVRPAMYCLDPSQAYVEIVDDDLTDYYLETGPDTNRNQGVIYYSGAFTAGHQNVHVDYVAGYSTVPYELEMVCLELVKRKYDQVDLNTNLKSEGIGKVYNYSIADIEGLPQEMKDTLDMYRKREF